VREAKDLSQKQVALSIQMDQSQYSKIENDKTDPTFSTLEKVAGALGVEMAELVGADDVFKEVNSYDKTLMEKLRYIDTLDQEEKQALYSILDALVAKKRLKDTLSKALETG
jgi:transcriptional regulator with XRE-family HTH domain